MYECPNCAGNLKFSIAKQMLFCEYCETTLDPYAFQKEKDAEEYEVSVFTCPQCGGEILSEDVTAATFCSFCGAATILDSRISKERRPSHIIPFTRTKEDCEEAYAKMMSRAFFAPDELKDKEHIEKFRGIYMPYWVYSFEKKGQVSFRGDKTYRRGNYRYTDNYDLISEIDESYRGISFDASASFSDNLSSAIAPFDFNKSQPFEPTFLSGFYADASDVKKYVYHEDAEDMVTEDACGQMSRHYLCRKYNVDNGRNYSILKNELRPSKYSAELAMLPVWFLSYRKGDRVCYAVVNGQTGKAVADLPVEPKKYLIGSALLAIPLFILLNLFFTITPTKILWIALFLALICVLISNVQLSDIYTRELGINDKGMLSQKDGQPFTTGELKSKKDTPLRKFWRNNRYILSSILFVFLAQYMFIACITIAMKSSADILTGAVFLIIIFMLIMILSIRRNTLRARGFFSNFKRKLPTLAKPLAGILLSLLILLFNPVRDEFYYIGAFVCMASVLWAIMDIIKQHNILTTRKLPQFNKRGGDENA